MMPVIVGSRSLGWYGLLKNYANPPENAELATQTSRFPIHVGFGVTVAAASGGAYLTI